MKAISLLQPWATLLVSGRKLHETRCWATDYRGPIAIHASLGRQFLHLYADERFWRSITDLGFADRNDLPRGVVLGIGELVSCEPTCEVSTTRVDLWFGDWRKIDPNGRRRYAWRIVMRECFTKPIPAKGRLGLWEWEGPTDGR
jgi:hypothetical protein